jgi:hypothetical protein
MTFVDKAPERKRRSRARPPVAPYDVVSVLGATEPREPTVEDVVAVTEGKRRRPVQHCLGFPSCGGLKACVDCREVTGEPASAESAADTAPITRAILLRRRLVLGEVLDGLDGRPFLWTDAERGPRLLAAAACGVELVTTNGAKERGHLVKHGAQPVGRVCVGARDVERCFVLHVQTKPAPATKKAAPKSSTSTEAAT